MTMSAHQSTEFCLKRFSFIIEFIFTNQHCYWAVLELADARIYHSVQNAESGSFVNPRAEGSPV